MKLTKCANGHFYDEEKYSSCPHCSGGAGNGGYGDMTTESLVFPGTAGARTSFGDDDVTVSNPKFPEKRNIEVTEPVVPVQQRRNPAEEDEEKTESYFNWEAIRSNEIKRAEGEVITKNEQRRETAKPVVGWLVCTSGSNYGSSFNLYSGKNFIGRDVSNEVCLTGDLGISRIKHAMIIYEPKQRRFYAQPGDTSHELFYLNDEVVLSNVALNDRDVLTIGLNTLVFVPFCDERNGWDVPMPE
ncbi:MAG: FHA domain-containing protein [Lachnospiraceae bacterium]|nr:FHA domain-containing protein [Lachnospiraceae bacterium]